MAPSSTEKLDFVWRLALAAIQPEPLVFFKPKKSGDGLAAKFNLRLKPAWKERDGKEWLDEVEGGLFVDLVAQGPQNAAGFPTFKWDDKASLVTAKLGMKDAASLRVAIRDVRVRGVEVPNYLRGKDKAKADLVSIFHQHESSGTSGITYQLGPESSFLAVSKSKDLRRSVSLTLDEELALDAYLEGAIRAFILLGVR